MIAIIAYFYEDVRYIFQDMAKGHPISFPGKAIKYCTLTLFALYVIYQISSTPVLLSKQYRDLIGTIETKSFSEEIPVVDVSKIPNRR